MIRLSALIILAGAMAMVALPAQAQAHETTVVPLAEAAVTGNVTLTGDPCTTLDLLGAPAAGQVGNFTGVVMQGLFSTGNHTYTGSVTTSGIEACIHSIVGAGGNPVIATGHINGGPFEGSVDGDATTNHCLAGSLKDGKFVTLGAVAGVTFSIEISITAPGLDGDCNTPDDVPVDGPVLLTCTGGLAVNPTTNPNTVAGAILCRAA